MSVSIAARRHHGAPRRDEALHGGGQPIDAIACPKRLFNEGGTQRAGKPDAKRHGQTADLVFQRDALTNELLAGDNQRTNGVGGKRLHMHRLEETRARQLRQAYRIPKRSRQLLPHVEKLGGSVIALRLESFFQGLKARPLSH